MSSSQSTACILAKDSNYRYRFSGVTKIQHSFTAKVATSADSSSGSDYMNGARNEPNKVVLSVIESDTASAKLNATRMVEALEAIKRNRTLCTVVTPLMTYQNMLLTGLSVTEDESSQSGWSGTLTFTESVYLSSGRTDDRSSRPTNTGTKVTPKTISDDSGTSGARSPLQQMADRAGVSF